MKTEIERFFEYIDKVKCEILAVSLIILLVYSPWIINTDNIHVDSEVFINSPYSLYNWFDIGRHGLVLLKYVLGNVPYNPFFSTCIGYILLCVAGAVIGYLGFRCSNLAPKVWPLFGLVMFINPILVEQLYFDNQILEIATSFILLSCSVALSLYLAITKKIIITLITIPIVALLFGTYQTFIILYFVLIVYFYVLIYRKSMLNGREGHTIKFYLQMISILVGVFIISFLVNSLITNMYPSEGNYLSSQIRWGRESFETCISRVMMHVKSVMLGEGIYFSSLFLPISISVVLSALHDTLTRHKRSLLDLVYVFAVVVLQFTPFLLTGYMGMAPAIRSQLVYPLLLACDYLYLFNKFYEKKCARILLVILSFAVIGNNVNNSTRLIYTDEIRAQEDIRIAERVYQTIVQIDAGIEKPIAFIGKPELRYNASCVHGELIGVSLFSMSTEVEPHYYYSNDRACRMLNSIGYPFEAVNEAQMFDARKEALEMPIWPDKDSIVDMGEYIIVKFAEDEWSKEVIEYYNETGSLE